MSEEEKEAIIQLRNYSDIPAYWKQEEYTNSEIDNYIKITLKLINKLQKENKELKEELQYYKDNIIEDLENRDRWE